MKRSMAMEANWKSIITEKKPATFERKSVGWPSHPGREALAVQIEGANDSIIRITEKLCKQDREKKEEVFGDWLHFELAAQIESQLQ